MTAEGRVNHGTAGRINVERGDNSVTLRLWAWSLSPVAVLEPGEARKLITKLEEALRPARTKATVPVADDDYSDIA